MAKAKNGKAIGEERRSRPERRRLKRLFSQAADKKDLATWRRAKAVLDYIGGKSVISLSEELFVTRGSVNRWLQWYEAEGTDGLKTRTPPGSEPRLTTEQSEELIKTIESGPQAAGFSTGVWTGPMIGEWIRRQYGIKYHNQSIPKLLHKLGFSVQRPRRRLARADKKRQAFWMKKKFPAIKKKRTPVEGSSSLGTRPAFGSTEPFTKRGPELDVSLASTHLENERQPISTEL